MLVALKIHRGAFRQQGLDELWIQLNPLYIQNICEDISSLYSTNKFPLQVCFRNKHFSSPFPPSKSIFFLLGYFVHSFDIVYIYYLKVNLTQIYLLKSHNLYLVLKRFHNHSRSSFREIILFAWNFKENLQLACIRFLFSVIKYKSSNQCTSYWPPKRKSKIPRNACFPWFPFYLF